MNILTEHVDNLSALPTQVEGPLQPVRLWVPTERVSLHLVPIPAAPERRWSGLLPWMLEDRVLQPVEQMHFAVLGRTQQNQLLVAAVSRADINHWLSMATTVGLAPQVMAPDYLALPWEEGRWTVYWRQRRCLVRTGALAGFAVPPDTAWSLIDRELQLQENPPRLSISTPEREQVPTAIADCADINGSEINWAFAEIPAAANLLTGEFRRREPVIRLRSWLPSLALVASVLVLGVIYLLVATRVNREEIGLLQQEVADTYGQLFGSAAPPADRVRPEAEAAISSLFRQREALNADARSTLRELDGILSRCACDLQEVQLEGATASLTFRNAPDLKQHFLALEQSQLRWSDEPGGGLVTLHIKPGRG